MSEPRLYELRIVASGEVRDADGNLISQPTADQTLTVTEQEALAIMKQQHGRTQ
jgi:hypothetical protein